MMKDNNKNLEELISQALACELDMNDKKEFFDSLELGLRSEFVSRGRFKFFNLNIMNFIRRNKLAFMSMVLVGVFSLNTMFGVLVRNRHNPLELIANAQEYYDNQYKEAGGEDLIFFSKERVSYYYVNEKGERVLESRYFSERYYDELNNLESITSLMGLMGPPDHTTLNVGAEGWSYAPGFYQSNPQEIKETVKDLVAGSIVCVKEQEVYGYLVTINAEISESNVESYSMSAVYETPEEVLEREQEVADKSAEELVELGMRQELSELVHLPKLLDEAEQNPYIEYEVVENEEGKFHVINVQTDEYSLQKIFLDYKDFSLKKAVDEYFDDNGNVESLFEVAFLENGYINEPDKEAFFNPARYDLFGDLSLEATPIHGVGEGCFRDNQALSEEEEVAFKAKLPEIIEQEMQAVMEEIVEDLKFEQEMN